MHMRHTVICLASLYDIFPRYLINGTIKNIYIIEHKMCVSSFSTIYVRNIFFILRRTERHVTKTVYWSSFKVPFIFVWF